MIVAKLGILTQLLLLLLLVLVTPDDDVVVPWERLIELFGLDVTCSVNTANIDFYPRGAAGGVYGGDCGEACAVG